MYSTVNKQTNKRITALILAVLALATILSLSSCGGEDNVTVTFMNGDAIFLQTTLTRGETLAAPTEVPAAPNGQEFKSWQLDGADYDFTKAINEDITLVATFRDTTPTVETVTVTFMNGTAEYDKVTVTKGATVALPTTSPAAPNGQEFKSWQLDGTDYDFTQAVNSDLTLVATFRNLSYVITFKDGDTTLGTLSVERGATIQAADVPAATDKSAEHLTFVGWYKEGTSVEIDYYMEIVDHYTYVAKYETTRYPVTLTEANGVTEWDDLSVKHGDLLPTFEIPLGYEILSITRDGAPYDRETPVTETMTLVVTLQRATRTVTFAEPGGTVITTATVDLGANAVLPTAPNGYYWRVNLAQLVGITENKTITLDKVAKTAYKDSDTAVKQIVLTSQELSKSQEKYSVVIGKTDETESSPALQSYALVMYGAGQYVEFTADVAGKMQISANTDKKGQHMTLGLFIDGYLFWSEQIDTEGKNKGLVGTVENIPAGQHTFRLMLTAATVDKDGDAFAAYSGIAVSAISMQPVKPETCTVTFMNGETVYKEENVAYGSAVSAPSTDPTPADGYLFSYWSKDGKTAYNFTALVEDDLTLIAVFERDLPSYTVTYKDGDGNVLGTVSVKEGAAATLPAVTSGKLWTATATEFAKLFNVTEAREVTLGTTPSGNYKLQSSTYLNSEDSINTTKTQYGADYETGNWKLQNASGKYVALPQEEGSYFTLTGNFSELRTTFYLNAGLKCTYEIRVDGYLVGTYTYDNTDGAKGLSSGWLTVLSSENMTAGQHTIEIKVAEGSGAVTVVRPAILVATTTE